MPNPTRSAAGAARPAHPSRQSDLSVQPRTPWSSHGPDWLSWLLRAFAWLGASCVLAILGAWALLASSVGHLAPEGRDFVHSLRERQGLRCIVDATSNSGHRKRHRALLYLRSNGDFILDGGSPSRLSFIDGRFRYQLYHQDQEPISVYPELERPAWLASIAIRHGFARWASTTHPDAPEAAASTGETPWLELRLPPRYRHGNRALIQMRDGWPAAAFIYADDEISWRVQVSHCEWDPPLPDGGFRPEAPADLPDLKYPSPFPGYHR